MLLRDAKAFVTEACQAPALAERSLIRWLQAGRVRWRCLCLEGYKQSSDPDSGAAEFWQSEVRSSSGPYQQIIKVLHVNWAESSACRKPSPLYGYTAYRIELAREDLVKFLPPGVKAAAQPATVKWIEATFQQMKTVGDISTTSNRSEIARLILQKMKAAVRSGELERCVSESHIRSTLRDLERVA
jgi:hypothetical protein